MNNYLNNMNSNNKPVLEFNALGEVAPVLIYIRDGAICSHQRRHSDGVIHNMHSYQGDDDKVKEFLTLGGFMAPSYFETPQNAAAVEMAKQILPLLEDGFGYMYPRTPELDSFVTEFAKLLLDFTLKTYNTDEESMAKLHNELQPLWSEEVTLTLEGAKLHPNTNSDGMSGTTTKLIWQDDNGVWNVQWVLPAVPFNSDKYEPLPELNGSGDVLVINYDHQAYRCMLEWFSVIRLTR